MFTLSEAEAFDKWITTVPEEEESNADEYEDFIGNDA